MGKRIILYGDTGDHLGTMVTATSSMTIHSPNGWKKACMEGDLFACQNYRHGTTPVLNPPGTKLFSNNGRYVLLTGATAACGCVVTGTSGVMVETK